MKRRHFVIGLGGLVGGGSLLVGTEALSAAEVERETTVGVGSDAEAVLAVTCGDGSNCDLRDGEFSSEISYTRTSVPHGRDEIVTSIDDASVRVGNQFREGPEVGVAVEAGDFGDVEITYFSDGDSSATIAEGESVEFTPRITADVPCSVDDSVEIRLKIERTSSGRDDPFGTVIREVDVDVDVEYETIEEDSDSGDG